MKRGVILLVILVLVSGIAIAEDSPLELTIESGHLEQMSCSECKVTNLGEGKYSIKCQKSFEGRCVVPIVFESFRSTLSYYGKDKMLEVCGVRLPSADLYNPVGSTVKARQNQDSPGKCEVYQYKITNTGLESEDEQEYACSQGEHSAKFSARPGDLKNLICESNYGKSFSLSCPKDDCANNEFEINLAPNFNLGFDDFTIFGSLSSVKSEDNINTVFRKNVYSDEKSPSLKVNGLHYLYNLPSETSMLYGGESFDGMILFGSAEIGMAGDSRIDYFRAKPSGESYALAYGDNGVSVLSKRSAIDLPLAGTAFSGIDIKSPIIPHQSAVDKVSRLSGKLGIADYRIFDVEVGAGNAQMVGGEFKGALSGMEFKTISEVKDIIGERLEAEGEDMYADASGGSAMRDLGYFTFMHYNIAHGRGPGRGSFYDDFGRNFKYICSPSNLKSNLKGIGKLADKYDVDILELNEADIYEGGVGSTYEFYLDSPTLIKGYADNVAENYRYTVIKSPKWKVSSKTGFYDTVNHKAVDNTFGTIAVRKERAEILQACSSYDVVGKPWIYSFKPSPPKSTLGLISPLFLFSYYSQKAGLASSSWVWSAHTANALLLDDDIQQVSSKNINFQRGGTWGDNHVYGDVKVRLKKFNDVEVRVIYTHLDDTLSNLVPQAKELSDYIGKDNYENIIVAGDLNTPPTAKDGVIQKFKQMGFDVRAPGYTYPSIPGTGTNEIYDYVMIRGPNLAFKDYRVLDAAYSDHKPILARINVKTSLGEPVDDDAMDAAA